MARGEILTACSVSRLLVSELSLQAFKNPQGQVLLTLTPIFKRLDVMMLNLLTLQQGWGVTVSGSLFSTRSLQLGTTCERRQPLLQTSTPLRLVTRQAVAVSEKMSRSARLASVKFLKKARLPAALA